MFYTVIYNFVGEYISLNVIILYFALFIHRMFLSCLLNRFLCIDKIVLMYRLFRLIRSRYINTFVLLS